MNAFEKIGIGSIVDDNSRIGPNVNIGPYSIVGCGDPSKGEVVIEGDVTIGAYCLIYFGATIKAGVYLDHYSMIGPGVTIGRNSKVLYGKHVHEDASIGENCIIGGHVADRTVIESDVTYLGEIAHSHRNPNLDWDENEEDSPVIYRGSVVGVNALIIGGRKIGPCAYVGAGEVVRTDIGPGMALLKGKLKSLKKFRGLFKSRCDE